MPSSGGDAVLTEIRGMHPLPADTLLEPRAGRHIQCMNLGIRTGAVLVRPRGARHARGQQRCSRSIRFRSVVTSVSTVSKYPMTAAHTSSSSRHTHARNGRTAVPEFERRRPSCCRRHLVPAVACAAAGSIQRSDVEGCWVVGDLPDVRRRTSSCVGIGRVCGGME